MKIGVSTASLFLRKENHEALPFLNELGVQTAEVFLSSFREYSKAYGARLAGVKGKVQINSVHDLNSQFEPQLFNRHEGVKEDAYSILQNVLDAAKELSAPYYTFHAITRAKRAARSGENDNFPFLIKNFKEISDFCQKSGVTLCLENVEWATYNRPGVFSKIAEGVPQMKGVLDIKQARISEYPYHLYLEEMGEKLAYAHISDIDENGKMRLPGMGVFNFEELIKRLQDVGFDGALIIEVYENDYQKEEELKISCEYMEELLYKLHAK